MSEGKFSNTVLEVETERLWLRPMCLGDLDALSSLFSDPEIIRHLSPAKPMERPEVEVALHSMLSHWERHGFGRMALIHKEDGKMIGYSGLRSLEGTPELVYTIAKPYWGEGLATEAARASLMMGFEGLQFDRIAAITKPDNWVSRHILSKIGFCFQGEASFYGHTVAYFDLARRHYMPDSKFFCRIVHQQMPEISAQNLNLTAPQVS